MVKPRVDKDLVVTDLHLHEWPEYGVYIPGKGHSRLRDGLSILYQASEYMDAHGIERGFFLGDLNHLHDKILFSVLHYFTMWANIEREKNHSWVFMKGNHDAGTFGENVHCLSPFQSDWLQVIDEPEYLESDYGYLLVPWMQDGKAFTKTVDRLRKKHNPRVVCLHHDLADVPYRGRNIGRSGSTSLFQGVLTISGHYHDKINVNDDFFYLGAPMQHDWSDRGKMRGMHVLHHTRQTTTVEFVETKYPQFVEIAESFALDGGRDAVREIVNENFVRILRETDHWEEAVKRVTKLDARASTAVDPITRSNESVFMQDEDASVFDFEEVINDYVERNAPDSLKKDRLRKIGVDAIRES